MSRMINSHTQDGRTSEWWMGFGAAQNRLEEIPEARQRTVKPFFISHDRGNAGKNSTADHEWLKTHRADGLWRIDYLEEDQPCEPIP